MKIRNNKELKKAYRLTVDNKMRAYGDTDFTKGVIRVNKKRSKKSGRSGEVLDTILHEEMHAKHPQMYERTVRKKTKVAMQKMNRLNKARAYARYA